MTIMDAIRAELADWMQKQEVASSPEVMEHMEHFYADSFAGASPADLAEASVETILAMIGPAPVEVLSEYLATWCCGVLLGVRASRRLGGES